MAITRREVIAGTPLIGLGCANIGGRNERMETILFSAGRAPEIPADHDLYGWLVGAWTLEVIDYDAEDGKRTGTGEVHCAWALEGRVVQDVWIMPRRTERRAGATYQVNNRYGTTIRAYDPTTRTWRITWINPVTGVHNTLIGRRDGDEIVQDGINDQNGARMRWRFTDIRPDAFHWLGEESSDAGETWALGAEFFARRIGAQPLR
jgi:hypothetical protein